MIYFTDMTGLAGSALVIVAASLRFPGISRLKSMTRVWLCLVAFAIILLVPVGGLSLAAYLRGGIGDLSTASMLLLLQAAMRSWLPRRQTEIALFRDVNGRRNSVRLDLLALIAILAVLLYPMALGWGSFDPYRLGYGAPWFLSGLLLVAIIAIIWRSSLVTVSISLAVLAWTAGWYESNNLWDYLLDPFVSIYAVVALMKHAACKLVRRPYETV